MCVCVGCVPVFVLVLLLPVGCLQCVLIDVACSFGCFLPSPEAAASCTALPRPFSFSSSFAAYNQFKCAAVHCKKFLLLLSAKSQCEAIKSGIVGHRMRLHYVWLLMLVCYRGVDVGKQEKGGMSSWGVALAPLFCCSCKFLFLFLFPVSASVCLATHFMAQANQIIYHLYSCYPRTLS